MQYEHTDYFYDIADLYKNDNMANNGELLLKFIL